jgi:hypothetical protein
MPCGAVKSQFVPPAVWCGRTLWGCCLVFTSQPLASSRLCPSNELVYRLCRFDLFVNRIPLTAALLLINQNIAPGQHVLGRVKRSSAGAQALPDPYLKIIAF